LAVRQSRADNCVDCHMPKRSIAVISHSALTNHRIPARPDKPLPPWKPTAGSDLLIVNQPEGRSSQLSDIALLRAYNDLVGRSPEYQSRYLALLDKLGHSDGDNPYVQAALAHQALAEGRNEEALVHLATGVRLGEAAVYEDMAIALANLGRDDEAIPAFLKGIDIDPYRAESRKRLILEYVKLKHYTEARHAMEEYVGLFPGDTFMRSLLARVSN
jgi:Flp pilus assembly protein TadD